MRLDVPCKTILQNVDITDLRNAVLKATDEDWNANKFRQETFPESKETTTILFKLNSGQLESGDRPDVTTTFDDTWNKWKDLVEPVIKQVLSVYDNGDKAFINKCLIPKLGPGMSIDEHIDCAYGFNVSHRIHVPLTTNDDVYFIIGGQRCIMEVGKAYEIDNKRLHKVSNKGETDRVHLLFDIFIKK
jgi:hypothetical protein